MTGRGWSRAVVTAAVAVCAWSSAAWACPPSQGWTYQPGEGIPECLEVGGNPVLGDDTVFTFTNGCVGEVTFDATKCDACTCDVGCGTPKPIAPGESLEVTLAESRVSNETYGLELQIGLVVYDARFLNDVHSCEGDGCAVSGVDAPARSAPWAALLVALGLVGWRRRRG